MKIKYYKPAMASMSLGCKTVTTGNNTNVSVPTFKDKDGNSISSLVFAVGNTSVGPISVSNSQPYKGLTFYASTEVETNFDLEDYTLPNDFTDLTINGTETITLYGLSYTLEITNGGSEAVTINSFKGSKSLRYYNGSNYTADHISLMSVVYLDSPVTIPVGATKTVTVNFSFYNA